MIKLKLIHNGIEENIVTKAVAIEPEGLKFFDAEMNVYSVRTWDKVDSYLVEGSVTEDQKVYAVAYQRGYSNSNPQHLHRPNTTGSLG